MVKTTKREETPVKTSASDPLRIDWIGRLGMTFAPGKQCPSAHHAWEWQRDLATDLDAIRREADVLVCLIEAHEFARMKIPDLLPAARARRLETVHSPIVDLGLPSVEDARTLIRREIMPRLREGKRVLVHCAGGLGRTGTIVGCTLREFGYSGDEALAMLLAARGPLCPEMPAQRAFVREWVVT